MTNDFAKKMCLTVIYGIMIIVTIILLIALKTNQRTHDTWEKEAVMKGHGTFQTDTNKVTKFEWNTNGCVNINH